MQDSITLTLTPSEAFALNEALTEARDALVVKAMHRRVGQDAAGAAIVDGHRMALAKVHRQMALEFEALSQRMLAGQGHAFDLKVGSVSRCRVCNRSRTSHDWD